MPKSLFTGDHHSHVEVLIAARKDAGLTQTELDSKIGKDQTFISIIERSQRRVDVLEFYAIATAIGVDPVMLFQRVAEKLPPRIEI